VGDTYLRHTILVFSIYFIQESVGDTYLRHTILVFSIYFI
jgi:hypothetical protein